MEETGVRLNKFLSAAGICSRREADREIEAGRVLVDGRPAVAGQKVLPGQKVTFRGRTVEEKPRPVLLMVNKPRGIVCPTQRRDRDNIVDFVRYPQRVYPVGRLDKESRGLILMTNQGELVNRILRGSERHEKEYLVQVDRPVTAEFLRKMASGLYLPDLDRTTRPCQVRRRGRNSFYIVLTQGWNRQIRRMCEACGYRVKDLQRIRIMNLLLGELPEGAYREVTEAEFAGLMRELEKTGGSRSV